MFAIYNDFKFYFRFNIQGFLEYFNYFDYNTPILANDM